MIVIERTRLLFHIQQSRQHEIMFMRFLVRHFKSLRWMKDADIRDIEKRLCLIAKWNFESMWSLLSAIFNEHIGSVGDIKQHNYDYILWIQLLDREFTEEVNNAMGIDPDLASAIEI